MFCYIQFFSIESLVGDSQARIDTKNPHSAAEKRKEKNKQK